MRRVMVGLVLGALSVGAAEPEARWTGWRGNDGRGIADGLRVPTAWSPEKLLWKTEIPGRGHSSPVVWGDTIFLTTAIEGDVVPGAAAVKHIEDGKEWRHPDSLGAERRHRFQVLALDATSGKVRWAQTAWEGTPYDDRHRKSSYAAPTPVTDGERVYAFFGAEGLYAYDFAGRLAWKADPGQLKTWGMGAGTSPVLHGDLLILQCDEGNGSDSFLAAYDRKTGALRWKVARKVQASWATPVIARGAGRDELVTSGNEAVIAYDPATGKELWTAKGVNSNAIPTPLAGDGLVVLSAGYPEKVAVAFATGGSGDVTDKALWKYAKGTAYVPSPILYQGHVYLMTDAGLLTCLDAKTGEVKYEGGRPTTPAKFVASPIAFDGKLLLFSEEGDGYLIAAGPKHEVLAKNPLGEAVYASPAAAAGRLYIRGERHLFAIGS